MYGIQLSEKGLVYQRIYGFINSPNTCVKPSALAGSTAYPRELVDRFFTKYTLIHLKEIEPRNHKFRNLIASSRLEIAFEGRPRGHKTPNYKVYNFEHFQGLVVLSELEVRHISPKTLTWPSYMDYVTTSKI